MKIKLVEKACEYFNEEHDNPNKTYNAIELDVDGVIVTLKLSMWDCAHLAWKFGYGKPQQLLQDLVDKLNA
jgi:hypothetical protein